MSRPLVNDFCFDHKEDTVIRIQKRGKYTIRRGVCRSCEAEQQRKHRAKEEK